MEEGVRSLTPHPRPLPASGGGELLLTAFCYGAELDELIPYEVSTAKTIFPPRRGGVGWGHVGNRHAESALILHLKYMYCR